LDAEPADPERHRASVEQSEAVAFRAGAVKTNATRVAGLNYREALYPS
jgi:hypothetical protein